MRRFVLASLAVLLAGCGGSPVDTEPEPVASPTPRTNDTVGPTKAVAPTVCGPASVGYPANGATGNRYVQGMGDLQAAREVTWNLRGSPAWLVGVGTAQGSVWVVASREGRVTAYEPAGEGLRELPVTPAEIPRGAPLAVELTEGGPVLLRSVADARGGDRSHPVRLPGGGLAYVGGDGNVVLVHDEAVQTLDREALPDARIAAGGERIYVLDETTARYEHGVLGDALEAGALIALDQAMGEVRWRHSAGSGVIEGQGPLLADFDLDESLEAVVTVSDAELGARYRVVDEEGQTLAESDPVGQGFRWRHQIAVAPLGPDGGLELVGVRTPHIGGTVEFFSLRGGELHLEAELPGYSSHRLGSYNLDTAVAGDFDADGAVELMVPVQGMTRLVAMGRSGTSAEPKWELDLGARAMTNLAVGCHAGRGLGLAVGVEPSQLRLWLPE